MWGKRKTADPRTPYPVPLPAIGTAGHDPSLCGNPYCDRLACMAYKRGYQDGWSAGYGAGYGAGYAAGCATAGGSR